MKYGFVQLAIAALFIIQNLSAQQIEYPKGIYMSWEEVKAKTPSQNYNLLIEERENGDILLNGGNDYKVTSPDESIAKKIIKKEIWAISDGENLYINCFQFKLQSWYAKAEHIGQIILFKGALSSSEAGEVAYLGGAIGGAIAATKRYIYRLGKNSGRIQRLDKDDIEKDLAQYPEELVQYQSEDKPKNIDTILKYAIIINTKLKL